MADKAFGVKQLNILGSGTPSVESSSDLNLNAVKVAISTNLTVGGVSTFTGNISANGNIIGDNATNISGINSVTATTYFGDGSSLTGVGGTDVLEKAGINTSGTSTFTNLNVSGVITATSLTIDDYIYHSGDTNTFIGFESNDTIRFNTNGSDKLKINSSGHLILADDSNTYIHHPSNDAIAVVAGGNEKLEINTSGINVTGIVTATSFSGSGANLTNLPGITTSTGASFGQVEWDVVNNGASSYRFTGPGNDGAEDNPDLYLVRGQRYIFNVNASGHPFLIRSSNGVTYSDGVINNGAAVGKVILNLQHDAPARLFYQCSAHSGMIGNIYVVGGDQVIAGVVTATTFSGNLVGNVTGTASKATDVVGAANRILYNSSTDNTTTSNNLTFNGTTLGVTGALTVDNIQLNGNQLYVSSGELTIDSAGGKANINDNLYVQGVSEFNAAATFNSSVSIAGTITYDDVTNVDSVGLITARSGVRVSAGGLTVTGVSTLTQLTLNSDSFPTIEMTTSSTPSIRALNGDFQLRAPGFDLKNQNGHFGLEYTGSAIKLYQGATSPTVRLETTSSGLVATGIVTATSFSGDGSGLTNIGIDTTGTSTFNQLKVTGVSTFSGNIAAGSNLFVGYSTSIPLAGGFDPSIQQVGTDSSSSTLGIYRFSADTNAPGIRFIKSRSSNPSSRGIVQFNDELGRITFVGDDGVDLANGGARISAHVDATPSHTADMPSRLSFYTANDGSSFAKERLTIKNDGVIGIGSTLPTQMLDVGGNIKGVSISAGSSITGTTFFGSGANLTGVGFSPDDDGNLLAGTNAGEDLDGTSGCCNVFIGQCAGQNATSGHSNVFLGVCAGGNGTLTGQHNIAGGTFAGKSLTSGKYNVLFGLNAGSSLTCGCQNVYIGTNTGSNAAGGCGNIGIGNYVGRCMGSSAASHGRNVMLGDCAFKVARCGLGNVILGHAAGQSVDHGCYNIYFGTYAGKGSSTTSLNTPSNNIAIGFCAGCDITSGMCNTFLGARSGIGITSGCCNVAIGYGVTLPSATGNNQLAIGSGTTTWVSGDGSYNVTISGIATVTKATGVVQATKFCGDGSGLTNLPSSGLEVDACINLITSNTCSGCNLDGSNASHQARDNVFIGCCAAKSATYAHNSIMIGACAGKDVTEGSYNIFFGDRAGCSTTTGSNNFFLGYLAGMNYTGNTSNNIAIGKMAGQSATQGSGNILMGEDIMDEGGSSGGGNIMIGKMVASANVCRTTGSSANVFLGRYTAFCHTSAGCNIAIGDKSGYGLSSGQKNIIFGFNAARCGALSGSNNILIGACSGCDVSSGQNNIFIGEQAGNTNTSGQRNIAIGRDIELVVDGNDQLAIGCCGSRWITGDSSFNVCLAGSTIKAMASGGAVCATTFYGDGSNLTGITAAGTGAIGGLTIKDEGVTVGTAGSVSTLNFVGGSVVAIASSGAAGVATITVSGFAPDAQENLTAGTCSGCNLTSSGCFNVSLGACAGKSLTGGDNNILLGKCAGYSFTGGYNNIAIGACAAKSPGSGSYNNIAMGIGALEGGSSNLDNIVIGRNAGPGPLAGSDNYMNFIAGHYAGFCYANARCNIVIGLEANYETTSAENTIAIGRRAAKCQTTGDYNIAFGNEALLGSSTKTNNTGGSNIAIGKCAGRLVTSGGNNILLGSWTGYNVSSGGANVFVGRNAGCTLTTGFKNIAIGCNVQLQSVTGSCQLAIGQGSSYWMVGNSDFNVGIGTTNPNAAVGAGNTAKLSVGIVSAYQLYGDGSNLTGLAGFSHDSNCNLIAGKDAGTCAGASPSTFNIIIGCGTGCFNGNGEHNVVMGTHAGKSAVGARRNVLIGMCAGSGVNDGKCNVYLGNYAGAKQYCSDNIAIGCQALCGHTTASNNTGTKNIALGKSSGKNICSGTYNITIGNDAGCGITSGGYNVVFGNLSAKCLTTGTYNVLVGERAGCLLAAGNFNVFMGRYAGRQVAGGSYNTFIGDESGTGQTSGNCNVIIGHGSRAASTTGSCQLSIGLEANNWITGNANFNVGIGTTNPDIPVGAGNTAKLSVGIVSAYQFYGDGSNLSGLAGFTPDAQENLYAGTGAGAASDADTTCNIALGCNAGCNLCAGDDNVYIGNHVGAANSLGSDNVHIGYEAGRCHPSSYNNVFIGLQAGKCALKAAGGNLTSNNIYIGSRAGYCGGYDNNIAIGADAMRTACGGCMNIAIGYEAMRNGSGTSKQNVVLGSCYTAEKLETGCYNFIVGFNAGRCQCSGSDNIFLGSYAGRGSSTVSNNTAQCNIGLGKMAGLNLTSGSCNVLMGDFSGDAITTGSQNTSIGFGAGSSLQTGSNNTFLGRSAGTMVTTGSYNVAIGCGAGCCSIVTTGSNQLAIGCKTCSWIVGNSDWNVGIGTTNPNAPVTSGNTQKLSVGIVSAYQLYGDGSALTGISAGGLSPDDDKNLLSSDTCSGCNLDGSNGCFNIFLGMCAGKGNEGGNNNVFLGKCAGACNTAGMYNAFFGMFAGKYNTTSDNDVMIGGNAGCCASPSGSAVFIGYNAGRGASGTAKNTGADNIAIGGDAGCKLTTGGKNIFAGGSSGRCNTSGSYNAAFGFEAMCKPVGSQYNIAMGFRAGKGCTAGSSGSRNAFLGARAGCCNTNGSDNVFVGDYSGKENRGGDANTFVGRAAGACSTDDSHCYNTYIGCGAGKKQVTGQRNIAIGCGAYLPRSSTSDQIVFTGGYGTFGGPNKIHWFYGCCNGGYTNVGIGTTNPDDTVGAAVTSKLSVGIISAYQLYGDGSNLTGISGGGGLSHWTESANTSSPNNVVAANRLIATGAGTTIDAVIQPKSTGAFLTNLPDGAAAGGNKRGCYAVDLQMKRSGAGCVAAHNFATISGGENNYSDSTHAAIGGGYGNCAGWNAAVAGGYNNKAGGNAGAVGGGYGNCAGYMAFVGGGQYNSASGTYTSILGGGSNVASGSYSINIASGGSKSDGERSTVMGHNACTRNRDGSIAIGAHCGLANMGKAQYSIMNLGRSTTDATQTVLNSRSSSCAAGSDNQLTIPTNAAYVFCGSVIANVTSGGDTHGWLFRGVMKRGSGNASLVGTPSIDDVAYDTGASGWSIALGVDTTNQALAVCVTGQSSTNITWVATVHATELQH